MSDLKIGNIKKNKLLTPKKYDISLIKESIKAMAKDLLGIICIGSNILFDTNNLSNDSYEAELLGYDESYKLVLFEFRRERYSTLIRKGFMAIDYIKENPGRIKVLLKKHLDGEVLNNLDLNPRLVIIGEDFCQSDEYAIKQTPYEVDLLKAKLIDDLLIIEKLYHSHQDKVVDAKKIKNPVFKKLHQEILSLGDEVIATGNHNFVTYRKIKNICYIMIKDDEVNLSIRDDKAKYYPNITGKDIDKVMKLIVKAYDEC